MSASARLLGHINVRRELEQETQVLPIDLYMASRGHGMEAHARRTEDASEAVNGTRNSY